MRAWPRRAFRYVCTVLCGWFGGHHPGAARRHQYAGQCQYCGVTVWYAGAGEWRRVPR